ncbi:hypothetical protein GCM10010912_24070 [Paenibacillus albidus]|uniref:Uncharacterized protein n=1 Tax=Paenibacillus albidus TaxID=2041023 RepID=A0A917FG01_9BACL|nr:hypothetical protein GCM10010912_24070 [Paenibacillus albidus]
MTPARWYAAVCPQALAAAPLCLRANVTPTDQGVTPARWYVAACSQALAAVPLRLRADVTPTD